MNNDERDIVWANVALWQLLENMKQLRAMCYRNARGTGHVNHYEPAVRLVWNDAIGGWNG